MFMRTTIVQYRIKPSRVAENEELVRAVYAELEATRPNGFHYRTFLLEDGVSFVHMAIADDTAAESTLPNTAAFQKFQQDLADRCDDLPKATPARTIGAHQFGPG
jgi:L-rhamnose mutarotase